MMKNIILQFILAVILLAVSGCSDYLEKSPELQLTEDDIYSDSTRIEGAVLGIYTSFKSSISGCIGIGSKAYVSIENIGVDVVNVSGNGYECLYPYEMSVGQDTQDNYQTWINTYGTINNANTLLVNLETYRDVAGNKYDQYVAEAKFCRGLAYYYLNFLYGRPYQESPNALSVPLRLQVENNTGNQDCARSTVSKVLKQVLDDTDDYLNLPSAPGTYNGITRASQGAALMLRMRVYMEMGDYDNAIKCGEAVEKLGYQLCPDIKDAFASNASCLENIFSFPMSSTNNGGGEQYSVPYFYYSGTSVNVDAESGIHSPLHPNYNLVADARVSEMESGPSTRRILLKFTDGSNYSDWTPIFRYAETLMDLAECYYHTGEEDKARDCLAQVRHRSLPASKDPLNIASLTGTDLLSAIELEKRSEFIGEAISPIDFHRRQETYVKREGTAYEFSVSPQTNGYVWPIPTRERANNHLIKD